MNNLIHSNIVPLLSIISILLRIFLINYNYIGNIFNSYNFILLIKNYSLLVLYYLFFLIISITLFFIIIYFLFLILILLFLIYQLIFRFYSIMPILFYIIRHYFLFYIIFDWFYLRFSDFLLFYVSIRHYNIDANKTTELYFIKIKYWKIIPKLFNYLYANDFKLISCYCSVTKGITVWRFIKLTNNEYGKSID